MQNTYIIESFNSKIDTIDQLISCVCPFNLELVNFFGPVIKIQHVIIRAIFNSFVRTPVLFVSAVQENSDLYELDIFITRNCSTDLNKDLEFTISNCLNDIFKSTKGVSKQLFVESNFMLDKMEHLFIAAGMRFVTKFCDLGLNITLPIPNFKTNDCLKFLPFSNFSYEQLNDLFLRSSINSLDCPEGLKFRNVTNVFNSLIYHAFFDANVSQVVLLSGEMVGFIFIVRHHDQAEIAYIGVAEEFRSRGIGQALLGETLSKLSIEKVNHLNVIVDKGNFPALNLYLRFGMKLKKDRILFLAEG